MRFNRNVGLQGVRLRSVWTCVDGLPVHARTGTEPLGSDAPTVVLVHGMVVSSRYMEPLAARLGSFCRVYAPDLPGYGRSGKPPRPLTLAALADSLAGWMTSMHIPKAALIGNSYGCQVIAEFAVRHRDMVERAVLQGPTTDPAKRTAPRQIAAWLVHGYREPGGMTGIMIRDYWAAGLRRTLHTFLSAIEDRIEDKLPLLQAPTLVVRGAKDVIVSQRWAETVTRLLPRGRLVVIPGVMHTINYYQPLEFTRVVRPFLSEGRTAGA